MIVRDTEQRPVEPPAVPPDAATLREQLDELRLRVRRDEDRRRALLHILKDSHESNLRLERSRRAMIHIMGDLHETTAELERREQELREKQVQLVQAGKLATLGELTTGIAHELNNPLNNIGLFVGNAIDQIEQEEANDAPVVRNLQDAMEQVRRATEIISHLRTFGRAAPVQFQRVDVNEVIERAASLMQEQLRLREVELSLELDPAGSSVHGNAIQLEQVVINLLTNARDAVCERGAERRIAVRARRLATTVEIAVADSGPGIPTELQERIFDPFFTTKEVGRGTGLGLSISYGIVTDHGGTIAVGRVGGRTEFTIELPLGVPAGEAARA